MGIVDQVKELPLLAQKVRNIELYEKLVSFQSDIVALQEENHDLRAKLQQLTEQLNLQAKVIWEKAF
jgi:regulator of replication initiation timing